MMKVLILDHPAGHSPVLHAVVVEEGRGQVGVRNDEEAGRPEAGVGVWPTSGRGLSGDAVVQGVLVPVVLGPGG